MCGTVQAICACTQITVYSGDGTVASRSEFGIVRLDTEPGHLPQVVESRSFGLVLQGGGFTLGYRSDSVAIIPHDDCRLVVWIAADSSPDTVTGLAKDSDRLCLVGPGATQLGARPSNGG